MKKLFLFLLLFLVNKNKSIAQNREISLGIGGMFIKNVETINIYEASYYNTWFIFGKNDEFSAFGESMDVLETKANTYSFQKSASFNIGYNYAFRFKKIKLRLGVDYSFWKQNFTFSEAIKSSKILEVDTTSGLIFLIFGTGNNPYPRTTKFTNTVMNFTVPVKLSYVSNSWEFGVGGALNMPLILNQQVIDPRNNGQISDEFDFPRSGIKQVGFSANINVIKWFDNTGIELGITKQFRDILNIKQQITYGIISNFPNLDAIPNKPLQVYCKIIKRF